MCKYCEPDYKGEIFSELACTKQDAGVLGEFTQDLTIGRYDGEDNDTYLVSGFYSYLGSNNAYVQAKINYCPMCGRKLREVD